jgi:hypothetical protein
VATRCTRGPVAATRSVALAAKLRIFSISGGHRSRSAKRACEGARRAGRKAVAPREHLGHPEISSGMDAASSLNFTSLHPFVTNQFLSSSVASSDDAARESQSRRALTTESRSVRMRPPAVAPTKEPLSPLSKDVVSAKNTAESPVSQGGVPSQPPEVRLGRSRSSGTIQPESMAQIHRF